MVAHRAGVQGQVKILFGIEHGGVPGVSSWAEQILPSNYFLQHLSHSVGGLRHFRGERLWRNPSQFAAESRHTAIEPPRIYNFFTFLHGGR
jgi:hypothetical protein